jgi:hypothetical protein
MLCSPPLTNRLLAVTMIAAFMGLPACGGDSKESPDAAVDGASGPIPDGAVLDGANADAGTGSGDASAPDGSDASASDAAATDAAATDAAADVESADAALCDTCRGGAWCVSDQVVGGAVILPDDAGMCPPGRIPSVGGALTRCVQAPVYHCTTLPGACFPQGGAAPSPCVCDPSVCPSGFMCSLGPSVATVQCVEPVP